MSSLSLVEDAQGWEFPLSAEAVPAEAVNAQSGYESDSEDFVCGQRYRMPDVGRGVARVKRKLASVVGNRNPAVKKAGRGRGVSRGGVRPPCENEKKSELFFITIPKCGKNQYVFDMFKEACSQLVVAQENHLDGTKHLHIFARFVEKKKLQEVREMVIFVSEHSGDVQTVKCADRVLTYITKYEYPVLYKGVSSSKFHFSYRAREWANKTEVFRYSDPFVLSTPQYYKFLQNLHKEVQENRSKGSGLGEPIELCVAYRNWSMIVAEWWNSWLKNGFKHKKKQLYLHGRSNVGKTSFVEMMVKSCRERVFLPGVGKFGFQNLSPKFHRVILFEEFKAEFHSIDLLKRLIAGEKCALSVKGCADLYVKWEGPVIFVSNYEPPDNDAFYNRINVVFADCPFWSSPPAAVVKAEVEEEEQVVFEISSDEEEAGPSFSSQEWQEPLLG